MAPTTGTAVLVLVAFVLPGFVALRYGERTYITRAQDAPFDRLLHTLYFSFLSYLVLGLGAWTLGLDKDDVSSLYHGRSSFGDYLFLAAAGIMVPMAIAEIARRWNQSRPRGWVLRRAGISPVHTTPSGWEHFFLQGFRALVRVTLKDSRVIGGYFGNDSFAGYTSDTPDLYLEQRWSLNEADWFVEPADGTLGVYLRADEIVSVEFYDAGGDPLPAALPWWALVRRWKASRPSPSGRTMETHDEQRQQPAAN